MANQIPGAKIQVQRGAAHFDAMEILPRVLARLKADSLPPREYLPALSEGLWVESAKQSAVLA
jgi:hypothetical protein